MADEKRAWAPPEHPERILPEPLSIPESERGDHEALPEPQPVWATVPYEEFGELRLPVFAIRRSDVAVLVETGWQGVKQQCWVPRAGVTVRTLRARLPDKHDPAQRHLPRGEGYTARGK